MLWRFGQAVLVRRSSALAAAGGALVWIAKPACDGGPLRSILCATALCEPPSTAQLLEKPPPPPQTSDDPEYNAQVLERWRTRIAEAKELWSKLDVAGAEAVLKLAVEDAAHFGSSSAPMATSFLNLAQLYRRAGRPTEAEPLLMRAADVLEQNAGPNNKVTLLALLDLAATQHEIGKLEQAAESFDDVLERLTKAEENQKHGREAIRDVRAGCLLRAAKVQVLLDKLSQAELHLREAIALTEERWGRDSSRLTAPCSELAQVLLQQRRRDEASEQVERALRLARRPAQREQLEKLKRAVASSK